MAGPYEIATIGDVAGGMARADRRALAIGSVAEVVRLHGGPYVIFGVGLAVGVAVGAFWFGGKSRG